MGENERSACGRRDRPTQFHFVRDWDKRSSLSRFLNIVVDI